MFLLSLLYNLLLPFIFFLYLPFYLRKQLRRGGMDGGFWERVGIFSSEKRKKIKNLGECVWIHSVSVGETVAALNMIKRWQEREPDVKIVLSTTTTTGQDIARRKSPKGVVVIYMPIDFRFAIKRTLRLIAPSKLVIFEVEIWPNLLIQAKKFGVPVALVNGRMSDRSFCGFAKHGWFFKPIFKLFSLVCVQSEEDSTRFVGASGGHLEPIVCNTMKFDQAPDTSAAIPPEKIYSYFDTEHPIVFNAASTHPGEESLILDIFQSLKKKYKDLVLILVPRHVERTAEIEALLVEKEVDYSLYKGGENSQKSDVLLVNVTGELLSLISVSDFVYVGKSLAGNEGGHNIIEPAVFGKPVVHGDNLQNFRLVSEAFSKADASIVVTESNFELELEKLVTDVDYRKKMGKRVLSVVEQCSGAIDRTIDALALIK